VAGQLRVEAQHVGVTAVVEVACDPVQGRAADRLLLIHARLQLHSRLRVLVNGYFLLCALVMFAAGPVLVVLMFMFMVVVGAIRPMLVLLVLVFMMMVVRAIRSVLVLVLVLMVVPTFILMVVMLVVVVCATRPVLMLVLVLVVMMLTPRSMLVLVFMVVMVVVSAVRPMFMMVVVSMREGSLDYVANDLHGQLVKLHGHRVEVDDREQSHIILLRQHLVEGGKERLHQVVSVLLVLREHQRSFGDIGHVREPVQIFVEYGAGLDLVVPPLEAQLVQQLDH
jgi:hypothetical protein